MRNAYTAEADARDHGLATGYNYWFGRPRAAEDFNRGLVPAGYLIASAEDMTHYLIAHLNGGEYGDASVLSSAGVDRLHQPAAQTPDADTFYAMGWWVGPIDGIPAVHHQGETFNFHSNIVLIPEDRTRVIVLMNAQNSVDLFLTDRVGTIVEGVASLLEGRESAAPPSRMPVFVAFAVLVGIVALQTRANRRLDRRAAASPYPGQVGGPTRAHSSLTCVGLRLGATRPLARTQTARVAAAHPRPGAAGLRVHTLGQRLGRDRMGPLSRRSGRTRCFVRRNPSNRPRRSRRLDDLTHGPNSCRTGRMNRPRAVERPKVSGSP